jgi:ribosomal protein S18 acetylase RimI-like enzyme
MGLSPSPSSFETGSGTNDRLVANRCSWGQETLVLGPRDDIVRLDAARYGQARRALGRAFYDYNLMVYAAPNALRRAEGVTSLYGAILSDCFRHGEVYVTSDVIGAACWLPPGVASPNLVRQIRSGMLALPFRFGIAGFGRLLAYDAMAQKLHHAHAPGPHWYLSAIGVEPERQGQGVGGALMRPILERADAQGLPCYLETHRESNVRLYEKHGFEISCRSEVPGHPLNVWAMLRKPRSSTR